MKLFLALFCLLSFLNSMQAMNFDAKIKEFDETVARQAAYRVQKFIVAGEQQEFAVAELRRRICAKQDDVNSKKAQLQAGLEAFPEWWKAQINGLSEADCLVRASQIHRDVHTVLVKSTNEYASLIAKNEARKEQIEYERQKSIVMKRFDSSPCVMRISVNMYWDMEISLAQCRKDVACRMNKRSLDLLSGCVFRSLDSK